jgi:hypothetical protein
MPITSQLHIWSHVLSMIPLTAPGPQSAELPGNWHGGEDSHSTTFTQNGQLVQRLHIHFWKTLRYLACLCMLEQYCWLDEAYQDT